MGLRTDLHETLVGILGSNNVYYQPPESIKLVYPCIIYKRVGIDADFANGQKYGYKTKYQVTCVDKNPDSAWVFGVFNLPMCSYLTRFTKDGLNQDLFQIYF